MHPFASQKIDVLKQIKQVVYWRKMYDIRYYSEKNIFGKKQYSKEVFTQGMVIKYRLNTEEIKSFRSRLRARKNLLLSYETMLAKKGLLPLEKSYIGLNERPYVMINPGEYASAFALSEKTLLLGRLCKRSIILCIHDEVQGLSWMGHIDDFTDFENLRQLLFPYSIKTSKVHLIAPSSAEESLRLEIFAILEFAGFKFKTLDFSESKQSIPSTIGIDAKTGQLFIPLLGSSSIHLSPARKDVAMTELKSVYIGNKPKLADTSLFKTPNTTTNDWAYCCNLEGVMTWPLK